MSRGTDFSGMAAFALLAAFGSGSDENYVPVRFRPVTREHFIPPEKITKRQRRRLRGKARRPQ